MNNNYYKSPKASWLMRQFWKACGADPYLLQRSTYSDQIKYFCLGGIVLATGVLAALAGGYAFYTIFEPKGGALDNLLTQEMVNEGKSATDIIHTHTLVVSCVFGLIWGMIIYNIDRFIVTSTGKGDGTEAITGQEFRSAIPRIIMGMIIALTISKPVEIRMFESEINKAISEEQEKEKIKLKELIDKRFSFRLDKKEAEKLKWDQEMHKYDSIANQVLEPLIHYEITHGGCKGKCNSFKNQQKKFLAEINRIKDGPTYMAILKDLNEIEEDKKEAENEAAKNVDSMDGLLLKLKLAHQEAGPWISLFITLLFMVIELTPIFFKMMLIKGPYDYMDDNVRELARAEIGIEIIPNYYEDKKGMEKHKVVNHAAELKLKERMLILKAQEELDEQIVKRWKENKRDDINGNLGDYIDEK